MAGDAPDTASLLAPGVISRFDRGLRVWFGLAMIVGSIQEADLLPWSPMGAFLVATAWIGFCPLYAAIGIQPGSFQRLAG